VKIEDLLNKVRHSLLAGEDIKIDTSLQIPYDRRYSQVYITLFQKGIKPIRWGTKQGTFEKTLRRIIYKLTTHARYIRFDVRDSHKCRILFEIVTKEYPCSIRNLTSMKMNSPNRFEPGLKGLKWKYQNITRYFMPTDGYTKSIMSVNQLLNYLSKQCGIAKKTNKINERAYFMRREPIEYMFIESKAYITYKDETIELHRGYPVEDLKFSKEILYEKTMKSIDWLAKNMHDDGSFLYFYDPYKDTVIDDIHPNMVDPLYNNILRHSGGTISLIRGYELSGNPYYLKKAQESIAFLLSTFQTHTYKNAYACYPYFNHKSKLGGAGIGLVAMMQFYMQTNDECYRKKLDGLVRHILSRVDDDGEMIGYYIHPGFNDGKPLVDPDDEIKKELFSFYYPGEALLGLALYYRYIKNIDETLKDDIEVKAEKALDFLVDVRPVKYDYMFESLPADAWLMQAIEAWVKVDGFKKQSYIDFVFNDTQQLFEHMYLDANTKYNNKDYIGGFYYQYGDHVYHDASRCEGVVSAYYLARYLGDVHKVNWIMKHMLLSAKGLMKTCHTPKSTYAYINPEKAIDSFRFKLTRAWVRVDSVQHTACFFSRLYMSDIDAASYTKNMMVPQAVDGYIFEKTIDRSGFSSVHLVKKENNLYALKNMDDPRFINQIEQEVSALDKMNHYPDALQFYKAKSYSVNAVYFLFEYASKGNLKSHIRANGIYSEDKALYFLKKMLDIIEYAHNYALLHLDIKPANILLHNDGYWLADWGLSKFRAHVHTTDLRGNTMYHAPEIYSSGRSSASDIYSLGCTLYYLVTGMNPYNLSKKIDNVYKIYLHLYEDMDLSIIKSPKVSYIIEKMVDKNPRTRIDIRAIRELIGKDIRDDDVYPVKSYDKTFSKTKLELYTTMANDCIPYAQSELARMYEMGNGVEQDFKTSIQLYQKASKQGFAIAEYSLGLFYYKHRSLDFNDRKVHRYLKRAADKGHEKAQYFFGLLYEEGYCVQKDEELALKWFELSARNSYDKAHDKLAKEYNKVLKINLTVE